jgi:hypothetical protein
MLHARSTLLLGSVASLRAAGLFEAYEAVAPAEVLAAVGSSVAGMWIPIDVAVAHYIACDGLGLSSESAAAGARHLRAHQGAAARHVKLGPKAARIDILACPLFKSRYFRAGYRGLAASLLELVCRKAYAHERPFGDGETALSLRVQWA